MKRSNRKRQGKTQVNGLLPSQQWLEENGYGGLCEAMNRRPELFSHIKQESEMGENGYIFTKKGIVQLYQQDGPKGLMVATAHKAARAIVKRFAGTIRLTIAAIGSIEGETLEGQFRSAQLHGATCLMVTADGETFDIYEPVAA
jgi:hypothetical protein